MKTLERRVEREQLASAKFRPREPAHAGVAVFKGERRRTRDLPERAGVLFFSDATARDASQLGLSELGDLRRVKRIVRVGGFVNCTDDFTRQSSVINGCSDLFVEVFGEAGKHARSAVGMGSLPNGITVEIEAIVEVE